jgi:hypothetical protein
LRRRTRTDGQHPAQRDWCGSGESDEHGGSRFARPDDVHRANVLEGVSDPTRERSLDETSGVHGRDGFANNDAQVFSEIED